MEAVAHCHLLPSSSIDTLLSPVKSFLPPYRRPPYRRRVMTHLSMKTPPAGDNEKGFSAPPPDGHGISLRLTQEGQDFFQGNAGITAANGAYDKKKLHFDDGRERALRYEGRRFQKSYIYGPDKENKTCIWPGDSLSWQDESSGITWVGVHGEDSICVVTRNEDLDATRLRGMLKHLSKYTAFFHFRKSLIVEIKGIADPKGVISDRFHKWVEEPFGVVSSRVEYDERNAIEFLKERVESGTIFTRAETVLTAMTTFEKLLQKKLKEDEIKVCYMDPNHMVYLNDHSDKDPIIVDLTARQIRGLLSVDIDVIHKSPEEP